MSRSVRWAEFLMFFVLLPGVVAIVPALIRFRLAVLACGTLWLVMIAWYRGAGREELGIGKGTYPVFVSALKVGIPVWLALVVTGTLFNSFMGWPFMAPYFSSPTALMLVSGIYASSVVGQELIYRSFFFWRYEGLIPSGWMLLVNCLAFGWAHIVYGSWITIGASSVAGILFSWIYQRARSFWAICLIHFLLGMSVFAMGYGDYFYRSAG